MMPDCKHIDHRHKTPMAPDDLIAGLRAAWSVVPASFARVETVHRLTDLGVVTTWVANGTTQDHFEAK